MYSGCVWKRSNVFIKRHFSMWSMVVVFSMVSYVCCDSGICCANLEFDFVTLYRLDVFFKTCSEIPACLAYVF
jgi:hypothetical protein